MQILTVKAFFTCIIFGIAGIKGQGLLLAQPVNLQLEHLTVKNGLSSNRVFNIIQDRQGFYWIATADGLNRFDGSSFKVFRYNRNDTGSLAHNTCSSLLEGDDGDIWVATLQGVCRYQKKKGVFKNYFFRHSSINDNMVNTIFGLTKDNRGNIWAASYGLWKIDPVTDSVTGFFYNKSDSSSLSDASTVLKISFDRVNKGLWMQTDFAINFFDLATEKFSHHGHNPHLWPVFQLKDKKPFVAVAQDCFWVYDRKDKLLHRFSAATRAPAGVHLFFPNAISNFSVDGNDNPVFSFELAPAILYNRQLQKTEVLPRPGINSDIKFSGVTSRIYQDRRKNKWLCTADGLYVIKHDANLLHSFFLGTGLSGFPNTILSFTKEKNNLWLQVRHRLCKYDLTQQKLLTIAGFEGKPVRVLYNAGDTVLWLSRENEILLTDFRTAKIISKTLLEGSAYFTIADKQNHFWVGTWNNGLYELDGKGRIINHYTEKNGLAYKYLICGWYDGANELWVGMNGSKGFARVDLQTRKIENFLIVTGKKPANEFNSVNAIIKDKSGNLWLGTYGGGLYHYNMHRNQFQNYQRSDGLSGENINTLGTDSEGNLWISTENGIDIMDVQTKNIRHVNEPMQQVNNDHISNLVIAEDGTFFYTADNKILAVHPRQYNDGAPKATLLISSIRVFDKEQPAIAHKGTVRLSYRQNFFTVEFSSLRVSPDIPVQYKYKLEGFNEDWIYSNNSGFANFTNVPPGNYTLLLNVTNEVGKWNSKPVPVSVIIYPPFWNTWWFYILTAVLIGCAVLFFVKNRVRQYKKRQQEQLRLIVATQEKEKKSISSELHDDLGVRLSALKYFVTSLRKYMPQEDVQAQAIFDKTITTIDESVEDVRYLLINLSPKTLNEYGYLVAVEDLVNKLSQLHIINISLKQKGMEKRLTPDTEAGLYRITQELINNTLKHAGAGSIQLNIEKLNGTIQLQYADDGRGFNLPAGQAGGYGIENIHTRVALLGGKIEWDAEIGKPAKVSIIIPYNHT